MTATQGGRSQTSCCGGEKRRGARYWGSNDHSRQCSSSRIREPGRRGHEIGRILEALCAAHHPERRPGRGSRHIEGRQATRTPTVAHSDAGGPGAREAGHYPYRSGHSGRTILHRNFRERFHLQWRDDSRSRSFPIFCACFFAHKWKRFDSAHVLCGLLRAISGRTTFKAYIDSKIHNDRINQCRHSQGNGIWHCNQRRPSLSRAWQVSNQEMILHRIW